MERGMAHTIEPAKSGRAKCRKCKKTIVKDELRFGFEVPNAFDESQPAHQWYHLECAAEKFPVDLGSVLNDFEGEVPDRTKLDEVMSANRKKQKPSTFPYAEPAPSGRSKCLVCEEGISKGEYRVAIQREIDAGGFARTGAGYLHPGCVGEFDELPDDLDKGITANSTTLSPEELAAILKEIGY
jgi:hypothetical protein